MKKVLLTATVQSHICQFHRPLADMLHEHGYEIHVAAKDNLASKNGLKLDFADKVYDIPFSRSPKSPSNIKAYKQLKKIINEDEYEFIHCNTPVGGFVTRLAARKVRKKGTKVIYTAHGFHFYKGAPVFNWLMYYPIEKIVAKFTDVMITISYDDYNFANKHFSVPQIYHMNGVGIDFQRLECDCDRQAVRSELELDTDDFVLLSIGELNRNKNNIAIINAIKKLNNPKIKYLIAGNGPLREKLEEEIKIMGLASQVKFLGYNREIGKYHCVSDAFCFVSYREGIGTAAIEAMYSGLPLIISDIRGLNDYSVEGVTGFKVNPEDIEGIARAIEKLMVSDELRENISINNKQAVYKYSNDEAKKVLERIYFELE